MQEDTKKRDREVGKEYVGKKEDINRKRKN